MTATVVDLADYQPKQALAHDTLDVVDELLYGGAAFGGKTEFGIRYYAQKALTYPGSRVAIFRRNLDELDRSIIPRWRKLVDPCCIGKYMSSTRTYPLNNGSIIYFLHCEHEDDVDQYDTEEWTDLWLEEASQFSRRMNRRLSARVRTSNPAIRTSKLYTTNPDGEGNDWLVEDFVDHDPAGTGRIFEATVTLDLPNGTRQTFTRKRAFIQAFAHDNPRGMEADPNYMFALGSLEEDEWRAKGLGDWTRPFGQFFKEWSRGLHVVDPMEVWPKSGRPPRAWATWRALDFGYDPDALCCLWFAQQPEVGRIYVYQELYETRLTDPEAKRLICEMSADRRINYTAADVSAKGVRSSTEKTSLSTWEIYARSPNSVPLMPANKSHAEGWAAVRAGLRLLDDGKPAVQVTYNCLNLIRTLPKLIYHKFKTNDIADRQEDHPGDCLRYGLLSRAGTTPALVEDTPAAKGKAKPRAEKPAFRRMALANRR